MMLVSRVHLHAIILHGTMHAFPNNMLFDNGLPPQRWHVVLTSNYTAHAVIMLVTEHIDREEAPTWQHGRIVGAQPTGYFTY